MDSFAARARASEGAGAYSESKIALIRHLEKMVQQGRADPSLLEAARAAESASAPTVRGRAHAVFNYVPGLVPPPRPSEVQRLLLGTQVSMGRSRWCSDDVSIFSVADGKRLASTAPPAVTGYEAIRMNKITRAALETPQLAGYRLLPELSPGRALLWGTIFAFWGTAAAFMGTARSLDIHTAEEASGKLKQIFAPLVAGLDAHLAPLKAGLSFTATAASVREETQQSELVRRLRTTLMNQ